MNKTEAKNIAKLNHIDIEINGKGNCKVTRDEWCDILKAANLINKKFHISLTGFIIN